MGSKTLGKKLLNIPVAAFVALERLVRPATKPRPDAVKCVLVLQYNLALGYCVHLTPFFETIKRERPEVKVIVATWGMGVAVLRHSPYVDHLIETPNVLKDFSGASASLRRQLRTRRLKPDCCLTGAADQRTKIGLLAAAACSGWRGGFAILPSLYQRPLTYDPRISLIANNLRLASLIGLPEKMVEPKVFYTSRDAAVARELLAAARADGRPVLVVISRGSGGLPTEWRDERWAEIIKYAHRVLGYNIVYVGTKADVPGLASLKTLAGGVGTSLAGATSISQLAAVIALSDMVVSIATGGLHVTRAAGTPVLVLGLAWEKPLQWLIEGRAEMRILRGPDVEKAPPGYRLDDISAEWVISELADITKFFPPDDAAREARLKAGTSEIDLLHTDDGAQG
jgi:ADP-heptose:LPS heptosyltransferase